MLAKVYSCAVVGLEGVPVEVEVDISQGLPSFQIVGLPDAAVQESKERVRPAVRNSGFTFPIPKPTQCTNYHISLCDVQNEQFKAACLNNQTQLSSPGLICVKGECSLGYVAPFS